MQNCSQQSIHISNERIPSENDQEASVPHMNEWGKLNMLTKQFSLSKKYRENIRIIPKLLENLKEKLPQENGSFLNRNSTPEKTKIKVTNPKEKQKTKKILSKHLLPLNLVVQTWFSRNKKKRAAQRIENLKDHQLTFLGDLSHIPLKQEKKSRKNHIYLSIQEMILRFGSKFLNLRQVLHFIPTIHPEGRLKLMWNIFFCICIFYQFFTITIELFFDKDWDKVNETVKEVSLFSSESLKYFILIDVVMNMITGYFLRGGIIMDSTKIFKNYLKRLMLVDFLVIIPIFVELDDDSSIEHMSALYNSKLSIIKLLFVFRLVKLKRTYYYIEQILSNNEKIEGFLSLLELCFKILFTAHLLACFWYFFGDLSKREGITCWMDKHFKEDRDGIDWRTYYLRSLYWSITTMITVGYGDITPTNNLEVGFAIISMIIGCGLFGYSLSNIGTIFEKLFAKENELRSKLRVLNRFMRRKNINFELQGKVRSYLDFILREAGEESSQKEQELVNKLSISLRKELLLQANGFILTNSSILKKNFSVKAIQKLTEIMTPMDLAPEDVVFEEGCMSCDQVYFVSKGQIDLYLNCKDNSGESNLKIVSLKEGDMFGEVSFFTGKPREFTAKSDGYTKVFCLNKSDFIKVMHEDYEDYESFCAIRDNLLIYNNHLSTYAKCYSCTASDHNIHKCPSLKYIPDRELVVRRYINRRGKRNHNFERGKMRTRNTLKIMWKINRVKERLDETYDFSLYEADLERAREDYRDLNSPQLSQEALQKSTYYWNEKPQQHSPNSFEERENEIEAMPDNHGQSFPQNLKIRGNQKKMTLIKKKNVHLEKDSSIKLGPRPVSLDNLHEMQPSNIASNHREHERISVKNEHASLFYVNFDVGKNFKRYFPNNNLVNVLLKIRKKFELRDDISNRTELHLSNPLITNFKRKLSSKRNGKKKALKLSNNIPSIEEISKLSNKL